MRWIILLAACTSQQPEQSGFELLLGTWSFSSGSENIVCPSGTTAQALSGNISIVRKDAGVQVMDPAACNFTYDVSGDRATLGADKSCSFAVPQLGQGATAAVTYDDITLSSSDGATMSDVFSGKVRYTTAQGSEDCAFSGSAMLSKVGI
jgi:hypothetical protein